MSHAPDSGSQTPIGRERIALQLYTLRGPMADDFLGTLRQVAGIGYRAVELAGFGGLPVAELRATLDDLGVRAMGAHVPLAAFEERLDESIADVRQLGCDYAVIPMLPEERRRSVGQVVEIAAAFNRYGAACREAGLSFAYHNHAFEFAPLPDDGRTLYDLLLAETDPALVAFELDAFWAVHAGVDPLTLLPGLLGRVPLLHVKDLAPEGTPVTPGGKAPVDAPPGDGTLPWSDLLPAAAVAGTRWYIVEQDFPKDPLADVERGLRFLESQSAET